MSSMVDDPVAAVLDALTTIHEQVDLLLAAELTRLDQDALVQVVREAERVKRQLVSVGHGVINEFESRSTAFDLGCKSTAALLRQLLHLAPIDASGRVKAAALLAPRTQLSAPVPVRYPAVAAAQAAGDLSAEHARIITGCLEALPDGVADEHGELLEAAFVDEARDLDPTLLARRARYVSERLNPDGVLKDREYRDRQRDVRMRTRADGSARVEIEATAELAEYLDIVFDSLAGPKPEREGIKDSRTPGQRRHDALLDAFRLLLTTGELPDAGGVPAQLIITMPVEQYLTGTGLAETSHGRLVPTTDALTWAGGDPRVLLVAMTKLREVSHYSSNQRTFSPQQRKAMIARDRGCTAPGCDAPPGRCDAHHVTDYAITGTTSIDDGCLACTWCHRELIGAGWITTMLDGRPHWIPPKYLDHKQRPRRNTTFDLPA